MKRIRNFILALSCLGITTSASAYDFSEVHGSITFYYTITSPIYPYTVEITSENSSYPYYNTYPTGVFVIPNSVTHNAITYTVTSISDYAFYLCSGLTGDLIIPDSVEIIGAYAFNACSNLSETLKLPKKLSYIGSCAFYHCDGLTNFDVDTANIHFKASEGILYNVAMDTLLFCLAGKSDTAILPLTVKHISDNAFGYCTKITCVMLPESINSIGTLAFINCSDLRYFRIPDSVRIIKNGTFKHCVSLLDVSIGNAVDSIEMSAFENCKKLSTVTIPNSVTVIQPNAFLDCIRLIKLNIGNSIKNIGFYAFKNDSNLKTITITSLIPPATHINAFYKVRTQTPVFVPCGTQSTYTATQGWNTFLSIQDSMLFSLNLYVNDTSWGKVVKTVYTCVNPVSYLMPISNPHCHFLHWNDGNTETPRSVLISQDTMFTAVFALDTHEITVLSSDSVRGSVSGSGLYAYGSSVTIKAIPNDIYVFEEWDDGNTDTFRLITVTQDSVFTAIFNTVPYVYEAEKENINIFPNPANEQITLRNMHGFIKDMYIYNVMGEKIRQMMINNNTTTIDVSDLNSGMYFLAVTTEKGMITKKVQIIR